MKTCTKEKSKRSRRIREGDVRANKSFEKKDLQTILTETKEKNKTK